jgi:hypothetical protein
MVVVVYIIYEREIRKYTEKASRKARASGVLGSSALQKTDSIRYFSTKSHIV